MERGSWVSEATAAPPVRRTPGAGRDAARRKRRQRRKWQRRLAPFVWVGPAVVLIGFVVLWPVVAMVRTSLQRVTSYGEVKGYNGLDNFRRLFQENAFTGVVARTAVWVVAVVGFTMLISLALAQLFHQRFPGHRFVRLGLIAPWAASVLMTAIVFRWMLQPGYGLLNQFMHALGIVADVNRSAPLGHGSTAMPWLIFVAVFVSLPFSTYTLLAGLAAIPTDVYEAAKVDGAGAWRTYWAITFPLLRPAITVATLINLMNVFNSFPIIWAMTGGGPGYDTSTTTIFMYVLKEANIGESAAMSVVNFALVAIIAGFFLRVSGWRAEGAQ